jgi:hypothetical protein
MHDALPPIWRWALVVLTGAALAIGSIHMVFGRMKKNAAEEQGVYATDPESEATHIVMLAGMLVMFAFPHAPIPLGLWRTIFVALLLVNGGLLIFHIRQRSSSGSIAHRNHVAAATYHVVAATAMLYMTAEFSHNTPHHAHTTAMATEHAAATTALPYPVVGWAFVVLFLIDGLGQIGIAATLRIAETHTRIQFLSARTALVPHIAMDITMAAMLIGMLR